MACGLHQIDINAPDLELPILGRVGSPVELVDLINIWWTIYYTSRVTYVLFGGPLSASVNPEV